MFSVMHDSYIVFGGLLLLGALFGLAPLLLPLLIMPRTRGARTRETYECGMETAGSAWIRFSILFYLFALIFIAFEVDVLYLIPVALVYDTGAYAWRDLVLVLLFLLILTLAVIFAWRRGVFRNLARPEGVDHD